MPDARIAHEESFGPVVTVAPVDSDAAAVSAINASRFGLTASIWTDEANVANNTTNNIVDNIGRQLEVGTWYVNRCDYLAPCLPWSGRKESGLGCSLGELGFHEVSRPKACLKQAL